MKLKLVVNYDGRLYKEVLNDKGKIEPLFVGYIKNEFLRELLTEKITVLNPSGDLDVQWKDKPTIELEPLASNDKIHAAVDFHQKAKRPYFTEFTRVVFPETPFELPV